MRAQHLSRLFALPLLLGLLGCGFHPAYQAQRPTAGGANMFAEIEIGPIYERAGQLLRQELQRRLEGSGGSVHKSYVLNTNLAMHDEGVAIEFGSSAASRLRVVGVATWSLVGLGGNQSVVASGWAKSVDGFDQIDPQYFLF